MAFESLSEKLQGVFKNLRSKGRLTEDDVKAAMREVKRALLEADVNFKVVKTFIKDINGNKIALSMKFEDQNPWNNAAEKYAVGNVVKGVVARMTDFGAFVELDPGVDALLHVSQISSEHVEKPPDVLSVGQPIEAKIVDLNDEEKKISLSIKALQAQPQQEEDDADVADVDIDAVASELDAE